MPFKITKTHNALNILLPATLKNVDRAAENAAKFIMTAGLDEYSFTLLLGMREALNNAVVKGCGHNRLKSVKFELKRGRDKIEMLVEDEGEGFDWRYHMERIPTILEDSGRGMSIFKQYFEKVEFNKKGNRVRLIKKLN